MQLPFLIPRVERLRADGELTRLRSPTALGGLRSPIVLLARDLCTFSLFETSGLPKNRRLQAARLHARAASPYVAGGSRLIRCGTDYGVWWWDLERIAPLLASRAIASTASLRPETLAQPTGRGWRIVQLKEGFEAQYWSPAGLMASTWRADRFDQPSWSAFIRLVRGADPAPELPPIPVSLPIAPDSEAFSLVMAELSRNQVMGLAAGSAATVLAGFTVFLLGQGLALRSDVETIRDETEALRLATPRAGLTARLETDRQRLTAYRQVEERTNPLSATGAAIAIVSLYDLTPTAVEVLDGILTLTLPYAAGRRSDELVAEFEGSGYFFDVRPRSDAAGQSLIIEMQVREAAPPLSLNE
ncbi:hypothetical protein [Brevundimonas variabilis]|uniref:Uncharacterized protein n=1 Tax=Brevundimonas variabilis TaxID=74312 RepID=A0A7W9FF96_9CAUL|nr:hypothetical protein [Brevundimonas variabilis]MBB5745333.1 hypothetical protein [Brevundimonas variabilis]